jgi:hypothetical protein
MSRVGNRGVGVYKNFMLSTVLYIKSSSWNLSSFAQGIITYGLPLTNTNAGTCHYGNLVNHQEEYVKKRWRGTHWPNEV